MKSIFRFASLVLCFAMLLISFAGCGQTEPVTVEQTAPETANTTEKTGELPAVTVPVPLTRERLESLPVANSSMTEEELRQLCISFFELSGTFQWTPTDSFSYPNGDKTLAFNKGVLYGGLPYTHASSDVYSFLDFYDEKTGVLDSSSMKLSFNNLLGNDCADAVFWAWARISNTISFRLTEFMQPARGCLLLGDYSYDTGIDSFREIVGTREVFKQNGEQKMFEAYALLKMADGLVCWNAPAGGHAQMIVTNNVVRKADGTIDGNESFVTIMDQGSSLTRTDQDGVIVQVECGNHVKETYNDLTKRGYLPIQIAELAGLDPVEDGEVKLDVPENADIDTLIAAQFEANYRISKVITEIKDASGNVVYSGKKYGSEAYMYSIPMSEVLTKAVLRRYLKGDGPFTITISALIGNGETLEAYSGTLASF